MKKLARARAKDRQASSASAAEESQDGHHSSTGHHESVQIVEAPPRAHKYVQKSGPRTCGPSTANPHMVHYIERSDLRRLCVVCSKRQHLYCPSCGSFMCMGPCFLKLHS